MDFEQIELEQTEKRAFQVWEIGCEEPGNEIEIVRQLIKCCITENKIHQLGKTEPTCGGFKLGQEGYIYWVVNMQPYSAAWFIQENDLIKLS